MTMSHDPVGRALSYVEEVEMPPARHRRFAPRGAVRAPEGTVATALETTKDQAAVVGSDVISFVSGVTTDRREAIVNSSLLAQLVAKKKVSDPNRIYEWYDAYFEVLTNVGWVLQDRSFAEYQESSKNFEAHKAILAVATTLLGGAPTALALVTTTLKSLQSMDESTPWIAIFNRESQTARAGRFQISLVDEDAAGQFFVSLMAFGLEAKSEIKQVLFFKARSKDVKLRHYSGRVTINTTVLDAVRDAIKQKLIDHVNDFVSTLPDLD
jgi:hypothetical protein